MVFVIVVQFNQKKKTFLFHFDHLTIDSIDYFVSYFTLTLSSQTKKNQRNTESEERKKERK